MKTLGYVSTGLLLAGLLATPMAQAAPHGAIPFYCYDAAGIGSEEDRILCWRADTGSFVNPVPAGLYMHVTDIYLQPNTASTTGISTGLIGVDDADGFPRRPSIDFLAAPTQQFHFTTPYLILDPGQQLAIANFSSSDWPVDVYVEGYLSEDVKL